MFLRILLLFWAFCAAAGLVRAQPGAGAGVGSVSGRVLDASTGEPIPYASIALMSPRDSAVTGGTLAGDDGTFRLGDVRYGPHILTISFMGYERYTRNPLMISPRENAGAVNLGDIRLAPAILALEAAEVVEERSTLEMMIDRRVFNVGSDLTASGSTATELLANVPSVAVDIDGNITLRGSGNVQILIDGRPSGMTGAARTSFLAAIPASSIERVEIITNPTAKYDPDGMAGILNIVLKKNKLVGLNGQIQLTPGTGDNHTASASLNLRNERFNLSTGLSWNYRDTFRAGNTERNLALQDSASYLTQTRDGSNLRTGAGARLGLDIYLRPTTTVSLGANLNTNSGSGWGALDNQEVWSTSLETHTLRRSDEENTSTSLDLDGAFRHEFDGPSHFISAQIRHAWSESHSLDSIREWTVADPARFVEDRNENDDRNLRTVMQVDYEKALPGEGKLELGWKSNLNLTGNTFGYLVADSVTFENGLYIPWNSQPASFDFDYTEHVHAVYGTWGRKWNSWGVQGGLRLEQVYTTAELRDGTTPAFHNDYFEAYPSFNLTRKRTDEVSWIASYSRRVNRPDGRNVNPFIDDSDSRNVRTGNPFLRPEFTNSYELSHQWQRGRTSLTTSLFFKDTRDVIRWYRTVDDSGISTTTFVNFDRRHDEGLEVIGMVPWGKGGSFRATGSVFHLVNNASTLEAARDNTGWSWNLSFFASRPIGKVWKVQMNGNYEGPAVTAQGRFNGFYAADIAVMRSWFDDALQLSVRVSDVFDTRQWSYTSEWEGFSQTAMHKRESRNAFLTLTWQFGKYEAGRGGRSSRGGSGGMDGGGGMGEF